MAKAKSKRKVETESRWMTLIPAYGRNYQTADQVLKAWVEGEDFTISDISWPANGRYISVRDADIMPELRYVTFKIRYGTNASWILPNFCLVKWDKGDWRLDGVSDGSEMDEE